MDLASVAGLEGLTIGALAEALKMSKSGLFAHFGAKEELQVATVQAARQRFSDRVLRPALRAPRGLARLCQVLAAWLDYAEGDVFRGGCFFAGAATEFDGRPGPVKEAVAGVMVEWRGVLSRLVQEAVGSGELLPEADGDQLAFEFLALAMGANGAYQLHGDLGVLEFARRAFLARLTPLVAPGTAPLSLSPTTLAAEAP